MQAVLEYQQPATRIKSATPRAIVALLVVVFCSAPATGWFIPNFLRRTLHLRRLPIPRIWLVPACAALALITCIVIFATIGKDSLRRHARRLAKVALTLSIANILFVVAVPVLFIIAMSWGSSINADKGRPQLDMYFQRMGITLPNSTTYLNGWSDRAWDGDSQAYHLRLPPQELETIAKAIRALPSDKWTVQSTPAIVTSHQNLPGWWDDKQIARGDVLRIDGP